MENTENENSPERSQASKQINAVVRSQAFCIFDYDGEIILIFDNFDDAKHYMDEWNAKNEGHYHCSLEVKDIVTGKYKYRFNEGVDYGPTMVKDNA